MSDRKEWPATHKPVIYDYGLVAFHDQACAVCRERAAVLNMQTYVFGPCWKCRDAGWRTLRVPRILRRFFP